MTIEEKKELCYQVNNLDARYLFPIAQIIDKNVPNLLKLKVDGTNEEDEEIEIPVESLSTNTLRELQHHIKQIK